MTIRSVLRLPLITVAVTLSLTACTGETATPGASTPPPTQMPSPEPTGGGELEFATVESLTAPRFQSDPNCAYGQWSENSTGIDEEFRGSATTIQQFDCYKSKDDVGGIPARVQQSIYVEFSDASAATAFGKDQAILYPTLVAGSRVVVAGSGLDSVDMRAYLADLQEACGCGEIAAAQ